MITPQDLRTLPLFAKVPEDELETIASRAADMRLSAGEWVLQEGEVPSFFGVLSGRLVAVQSVAAHEKPTGTFAAGDFLGELSLLLRSPSVGNVRTAEPSRLFRLDPVDFHDLVNKCQQFRGEVIAAMTRRIGQRLQATLNAPDEAITIVGDRWDLACHDVRDFILRNHVPYRWLDPREDRHSAQNPDSANYPVVILPDGERIAGFSYRQLAERIGLHTRPSRANYDLVIVGGGPAGLAAAVYGASEGLQTLLVERVAPGGQAGTSSQIANYPGFPAGVSGAELSNRALLQARQFGTDIVVAREVTCIDVSNALNAQHWIAVTLDGGEKVCASSVVLAMGLNWRRLDVKGSAELEGRGVYYGAARIEAQAMRGKRIVLLGGGNSAGQAAMFLADYAAEVRILIRNASIAETMSQYLIDQIATRANIVIEPDSEVVELQGDDHVERIVVRRVTTGEQQTRQVDALFVFIGAIAETSWLPDDIIRDEEGYVCVGRDMLELQTDSALDVWPLDRDPYIMETSVPGIFAVGDVRHGSVKRVASAVGEGSMSIAFVHRFLQQELGAQHSTTR
jgi:thioredoxin reductase (NADPH)